MLNGYCVLDVKTGLFSQPVFLIHDQVAVRAFVELSQDKSTTIGKYPADYVLMFVGQFDDNLGMFVPSAPRNLGVISALVGQSDVKSYDM